MPGIILKALRTLNDGQAERYVAEASTSPGWEAIEAMETLAAMARSPISQGAREFQGRARGRFEVATLLLTRA